MGRYPAPNSFVFTVEGNGPFPFDMLRYDHCWPYTEREDSTNLTAEGRRRVVLQTSNPSAPTNKRWESFCWKVVGLGEVRS